MSVMTSRRVSLCGVRLDALTRSDLLQILKKAIDKREKSLILNHNLHSLYLYQTSASFRNIYALASRVYIDGLPVVWLGKAAGLPLMAEHRITFLDCFEKILAEASQNSWRVFYVGSSGAVMAKALPLLRARYPQLVIDGRDGFFPRNGTQDDALIAQINGFRTDILFVGMGMPRQEEWLAQHYQKLKVGAALTSGATLDYVTGDAYRPPAWAGALGLYGIFRMFSDPKRLWHRYLVEPIHVARHFLPAIILDRFRQWPSSSRSVNGRFD
jgi:N-acetylglucosaminyldiphosphoundecaprenol N-acetyl-beta-D-mannosaminyltransferase